MRYCSAISNRMRSSENVDVSGAWRNWNTSYVPAPGNGAAGDGRDPVAIADGLEPSSISPPFTHVRNSSSLNMGGDVTQTLTSSMMMMVASVSP